MKKINTFLIISLMLVSLLMSPYGFVDTTLAIDQHETSSGTVHGFINPSFSFINSVSTSDYIRDVWCNSSYIFATTMDDIYAYKFNGSDFTLIDSNSLESAYIQEITYDENYVYLINDTYISAYSFSEVAGFTFITSNRTFWDTTNYFLDIWTDGTYIYATTGSMDEIPTDPCGIYAFSFNGISFTLLDNRTDQDCLYKYGGIWGNGTYIYTTGLTQGQRPYMFAYYFDGTSFSLNGSITGDNIKFVRYIYGDSNYIYCGGTGGSGGLRTYSFNGTDFTYLASITEFDYYGVWANEDFVFGALDKDGIGAYIFDGTNFNEQDRYDVGAPVYRNIWYDGNYVYATHSSTISAFSGFGSFNVTRTTTVTTESDEFTFIPSVNYTNTILKIPISNNVRGIIDVTNNTGGTTAIEVNNTGELINNTFWYDSTNQFVYIGTINITTSTEVNWTVNCSYEVTFYIHIPTYKKVGDDIFMSGSIEDNSGVIITDMTARTHIYYSNGTDAITPIHKWNCTGGNYFCCLSTTSLLPGIYSVSIEFTDTTSGITFKYGKTLYLSWTPIGGVYSDAIVHIAWYNTNDALGLPDETLQLYVDDELQYKHLDYYTYIGAIINVTVKDYYNFVLYSDDIIIDKPDYPLNLGLTFHEYDFTNSKDEYYIASFLKSGGTRWFEKIVAPGGGQKDFLLPSGNYTIRVYNADNSSYLSWIQTIDRSRGYLIAGNNITQVIEGLSVVRGQILQFDQILDQALTPDVTIISRNPPTIYSIYDKEGMAFGNEFYKICPALITIATTRVTSYGNWINSTPMIPGNGSVLNGTVTIICDTLYLSGPNSITWVNITYTDNGTVMRNDTYIPTIIDLYGQNLTINASGDLSIIRKTKYNQLRKFDWTYYPFSGYGPDTNRAGWHSAGIEIINPMSVPLYEVYAIAGFSDESNPDGSSVEVRDTTNGGIISERGPTYDVTDVAIHFNLVSMDAGETRAFTIGYYKLSAESYTYSEGTVSIPTFTHTVWSGDSYNTFKVNWNNPYDTTFRGALYVTLNFKVPIGVDTTTMRVWDLTNNHELDPSMFIPGDKYIRISAEAMGDVLPGASRQFDVYFLMETYAGADPKELHLNTQIFLGITPFMISFIAGVAFLVLGIYLAVSDRKEQRDRWKVCVALGIFIIVVFYILAAMGL